MGPTATITENRHDSGWELRKLSSGYMYQKIRKTNSVHSSDFWIICYKFLADFL